MELIYKGKTKDVFKLTDGNFLLKFKDDATGENGVFDPGSNSVGLQIEGMGNGGLRMSSYFFKLLQEKGIKTHWISSDLENTTMTVLPAKPFGKGVEVICRYRAVGSFIRRYGMYIKSGTPLDGLVEVTLKDDERGDPLITGSTLEALGIMIHDEHRQLKKLTKEICEIIKTELATKDLELYDIKLEFGRNSENVILIDEISAGNMRVYRNGTQLDPLELTGYFK